MPDIRSYGDHRVNAIHYKGNEDPATTLTFGTEVEMEAKGGEFDTVIGGRDNALDMVEDIMGTNVYWKHDGSLRGRDAIEMISEPCSLAYHMYTNRWKYAMKTLTKVGYRSHDCVAGRAGFHVHVGREQLGRDGDERAEVIRKIKVYLTLNWDDVVRFTRRRRSELSNWASSLPRYYWMDDDFEDDDTWERHAQADIPVWNSHDDRYIALNCDMGDRDNRPYTIEFRIFKGTLKRDTYIATLQWVHDLVKWAQRADWHEVRHCSFLTPFAQSNYDELLAYFVARGLAAPEQVNHAFRRQPDFRGIDGIPAVA